MGSLKRAGSGPACMGRMASLVELKAKMSWFAARIVFI
jgi:hypothetical protein